MKKRNDDLFVSSWRQVWGQLIKNKHLLLLIMSVMITGSGWFAQISGSNSVCQGGAYVYSVPAVDGEFYTWSVSGGEIVSPTATENQVSVYWDSPGTGTLSLVTQPTGATTTLDVTVVATPVPFLVPNENLYCSGGEDYVTYKIRKDLGGKPYSFTTAAPYDTGLPCVVVCENSTVTYSTPYHPGSTYTWTVTGALSYTATDNAISVVWGTPGYGLITVSETSSSGCSVNDQICVEVLDSPDALFTSIPAPVANTLTVCSGQTVYFSDQSTGATTWAWDFGDGYVSSTQNPNHTFLLPGTYTVVLTVSNYAVGTVDPIIEGNTGQEGGGEVIVIGPGGGKLDGGGRINEPTVLYPEADFTCNCTGTYSITVIVEEFPAPIIECVSTVCSGDTATYSTPADCPDLNWEVSNGTILSQAGNAVTVVWGDGLSGAGYLTLNYGDCPGYCDGPAVVQVPIIPTALTISGTEVVCLMSVHKYTVPQVAGVTYTWTATDGNIIDGQGTNEVTVFWDKGDPGTYQIALTYGNDLLSCGGSASLDVLGVPELVLQSTVRTLCEGTTLAATPIEALNNNTMNPAAANWSVITPAGVTLSNVQTNSSQFSTYPFNAGPGTYLVIAKPATGTWCNDEVATSVTVVGRPEAPIGIIGEEWVCPNTTHTYAVQGSIGNATYNWSITNTGYVVSTQTGETATVTWGSGDPYQLTVTQSYANLAGCTSDPFTLVVHDKSLTPLPEILGPAVSCTGGTIEYTLSQVLPDVVYKWEIITPEMGNILTSVASPDLLKVVWGTATGTATIKLSMTICDKTFSVSKEITLENYTPTFTAPSSVCVNAPVNITGPADGTYFEYSFGNTETSSAANPVTDYDAAGSYIISLYVLNAQNCSAEVNQQITVNPLPLANITTAEKTEYLTPSCGIDPVNNNLYALQNTAGTYTYQWIRLNDNTFIGTSNPMNVTQTGTYQAIVTDALTGCSATSDKINIVEVGCGCDVEQPHSADFTSVKLTPTCNEVQFFPNLSSNLVVQSWWFRDENSGTFNYSTEQNPVHAFSEPGYFYVRLYYKGPKAGSPGDSSVCYVDRVVFLPIVANFEYQKSCDNDEVVTSLLDQSGYFNDGTIDSYDWQITGAGGTFSSNVANPQLVIPGGTYTVTLTVTSTAYDVECTTTKVIEVPETPVAAFDFVNGVCPGELVEFTDQSTPAIDLAYWSWGFPSGIAPSSAKNPKRVFTTSGTVLLTIINKWGCAATAAGAITVNEPENEEITASGPTGFCLGGSVTLTAPEGGNYEWSNGATTQSITVSTADVYTVELDGNNGCRYSTAPVTVTVYPRPNPVVTGNTNLCAGEQINLTTASGYNSYVWSFNAEPTSDNVYNNIAGTSNTQSFVSEVWRAGDYRVTVSNSFQCTGTSAPYHVSVNPVPPLTFVQVDQAGPYCEGTIYTISVVNPDPTFTYVWSTGQIGDTIRARDAGVYSVVAYNANGCSSDGQFIVINEVPDASAVMTGCYEVCRSAFPITVPGPAGYQTYAWYHNGTVVSNNQDLTASEFGTYYLVLANAAGCTATSGEVIITPLPSGEVDLSATIECCTDRIICQGSSATLPVHFTGTGPYTFTYSNGSTSTTITTSNNPYNLVVTPSTTTTYTLVSVSSANESGCFEVCGEATVAVKDCTPLTKAEKGGKNGGTTQDCSINCFSASVTNVTTSNEGCKTLTMNVSCTGTCQAALSNFGISVGCGEVTQMSNSMGFPMFMQLNDPNTGLNGIKVDNISGICSSDGVNNFTITYTLCPDPNGCGFGLCDPVVAYKAGTCTYYGTAPIPSSLKSIASQESNTVANGMNLRVYPNPFADATQIEVTLDETAYVKMEVVDVLGQQVALINNSQIEAGSKTFSWGANAENGQQVPAGIYYIRTNVNGQTTHTKVMYVK